MRFATPHSAGATCMTVGQLSTVSGNGTGNGTGLAKLADSADDQVHISLQKLHMHCCLKHSSYSSSCELVAQLISPFCII